MKTRRTAAFAAALTIATTLPAWSAEPYVLRFTDAPERQELLQQKRDPATAAVLSAIFPGVGQIYAGNWPRGLVIAGIGLGLIVTGAIFIDRMTNTPGQDPNGVAPLVTGITLGGLHLWNIRDAYYTSDAINADLEDRSRGTALPKGPPF